MTTKEKSSKSKVKRSASKKVIGDIHAPHNTITTMTQMRLNHYQSFLNEFNYTTPYLKELCLYVQSQIESSYENHNEDPFGVYDSTASDFRSLDTCIINTPNGTEKGIFYGIDVGGTNMRVVRCELLRKGETEMTSNKYDIASHDVGLPKGLLDKNCTASMLFDYIADACKKLIDESGDHDKWISIGFTFSFATQMVLIDRAVVMSLSKGFETGKATCDPLVGQDCVAMMNHALKRKSVKAIVSGCLNDTTGTLLTAAYEAGKKSNLPPVRIGMIIGTGFNTCLADEKALRRGYQGSLINLESGGLKCTDHLVDLILDSDTSNPYSQNAEKKISGRYLGEVIRISLLYVLQSESPPNMYTRDTLDTPSTAKIFACEPDKVHSVVRKVMKAVFDWDVPTDEHCEIVAGIVDAAWNRSAAIAAAIIAGCAQQTNRLRRSMGGLSVGVDGSVYCMNPLYQTRIRDYLSDILGETHELLHIVETSDGSGKGAAMLACANPANFSHMH